MILHVCLCPRTRTKKMPVVTIEYLAGVTVDVESTHCWDRIRLPFAATLAAEVLRIPCDADLDALTLCYCLQTIMKDCRQLGIDWRSTSALHVWMVDADVSARRNAVATTRATEQRHGINGRPCGGRTVRSRRNRLKSYEKMQKIVPLHD